MERAKTDKIQNTSERTDPDERVRVHRPFGFSLLLLYTFIRHSDFYTGDLVTKLAQYCSKCRGRTFENAKLPLCYQGARFKLCPSRTVEKIFIVFIFFSGCARRIFFFFEPISPSAGN